MSAAPPIAPWIVAALGLHALLVATAPDAPPAPRPAPPPVEIELPIPPADLQPPPPPPTPPPPTPPPPTPDPSPAPARAPAPAAARVVAPVARAAPLLTAAPSPEASPVAFVTDPNGTAFGSGVVARGGTAQQGTAVPAAPSAAPGAPAPVETSTPPEDWTRPPRLDESDPCSGFFPRRAAADTGRVALVVVIEPGGRVASTAVAEEAPPGDGFGEAARACLKTKIFSPALGLDGKPTRAIATVRIRFSR